MHRELRQSEFGTLEYPVRHVISAAVALSVIWTIVVLLQDPMLNTDVVTYQLSAGAVQQGDWQTAFSLQRLPFYPLLIALLQSVSGLTMESSVYVVNGAFQALLVATFIGAASLTLAERHQSLLAAANILCFVPLNEYRSEIIRDHGYWALMMSAILVTLIAYWTQRKFVFFGSILLVAVASLFRVEGMVLLAAWSSFFLLNDAAGLSMRVRFVSATYVGALLVAVILAQLLPSFGIQFSSRQLFDLPLGYFDSLAASVSQDVQARVDILRNAYLSRYSSEYALPIVAGSYLCILFCEIVAVVSVFYFALFLFGVARAKNGAECPSRRLICSFWRYSWCDQAS